MSLPHSCFSLLFMTVPTSSSRLNSGPRSKNRTRAGRPRAAPDPELIADSDAPEAYRVRVDIDDARMDIDALKVVRRLVRHGFEAYLVGGGVRDLLLGRRPKDFDVATAARPEQIRRLFRNSRIIGRRFRLVHVIFGAGKVIEVATFRRPPDETAEGDELLIRSDNVFGHAHEDAIRRDLTINGLLYDVESKEVLDFVGGMPDVRQRVVRTIGDPHIRFLEDPVRMLRAIKFSARLDLGIVPDLYDAILSSRETITDVARPRLLEELLKLLRCGASHRALWLMWETGLMHVVAPEVATFLDDGPGESESVIRFWRMFTELDRRTAVRGAPLHDITLMALLLIEPMLEAVEDSQDRALTAYDFAESLFQRLAVPRRMSDGVCRIAAVLPKLEARKPGRFARTELYKIATEVLSIAKVASEATE
jgi:poly(A) polymerase